MPVHGLEEKFLERRRLVSVGTDVILLVVILFGKVSKVKFGGNSLIMLRFLLQRWWK